MPTVDPTLLTLYNTLDLIGVVLNGAIGGSIARQRNFDLVGFTFLALFSALGGGMLRDTLMQRGTPAAIAEPTYMGAAILGGLIAAVMALDGRNWDRLRIYGDAVVLGVWAVTGSSKALTYGMPWPSALFMGMITAVGGGMIRDIATGVIPAIFGGNTLYALPAILASTVMVGFHFAGMDAIGMIVATLVGSSIAIIASRRGWTLPSSSQMKTVQLSPRQLSLALKRAERAGVRRERLRWSRKKCAERLAQAEGDAAVADAEAGAEETEIMEGGGATGPASAGGTTPRGRGGEPGDGGAPLASEEARKGPGTEDL